MVEEGNISRVHVLIEFKMLIEEADMGNDKLNRNPPKLGDAYGLEIWKGSLSIWQCKIYFMYYIQITLQARKINPHHFGGVRICGGLILRHVT